MFFHHLKHIVQSKSLIRSFNNFYFNQIEIKGKVIDLGSKNGNSSYYEYLKIRTEDITFVDFFTQKKGVIKMDLEKNLPLADITYDTVILSFTLEHIYNYSNLLNEIYRIMTSNSEAYISVPFIHQYHKDPDDFNRFTKSKYIKEFKKIGFKKATIKNMGYGPFTAAYALVSQFLYFRIIKTIFFSLCYLLDKIFKTKK